eukprot:2094565-Pyramimonas_sp.AAC.1
MVPDAPVRRKRLVSCAASNLQAALSAEQRAFPLGRAWVPPGVVLGNRAGEEMGAFVASCPERSVKSWERTREAPPLQELAGLFVSGD